MSAPFDTMQFFSEALSDAMDNKGMIPGDTAKRFSLYTTFNTLLALEHFFFF
jgi:hypothetical protein